MDYLREQPFILKVYGCLYWSELFFFKQFGHIIFFSIAIKLNIFFLTKSKQIFFNALYKGVSQYSFLDVMHIAHIYYKFPCYISHLHM